MSNQRAEILAEIERRRFEQNVGLVGIYNYYRVFVSLALLAVFSQSVFTTQLGSFNAVWFGWTTMIYIAVTILSTLLTRVTPRGWLTNQTLSLVLILFDVIVLVFLTYCSSGVSSGLAAIILITVAAGAILLTGQRATVVAAAATIALLYEEFYLSLASPPVAYDFFQAGVFGALFFIASLSIQRLSARVRQNDIRALTQAAELADLERLNKQIIQRMRTGIVVVDQNDEVRMFNQSAKTLITSSSEDLTYLPPALSTVLSSWRKNMNFRTPPFQVDPTAPVIRVNFSAVRHDDSNGDVTIFIEDIGEIQQQAQQLKLAELGRLSASIAHEVRNPLGAISHAAQLLNESTDLAKADQRLTEIIISHCERMNGVVENVLEMSRRTTPSPTRVELETYLNEFCAHFRQAVPDALLQVKVDPKDTSVRIDADQLNQALTNLVENGIRYSAENVDEKKVTLEGGIDVGSDRPFLNVIDFGTGVAEDIVPNLFEPFETTSIKGTGLGLYISRELCEANQAQLSYYKHHLGGSCFRILFAHPDRITG